MKDCKHENVLYEDRGAKMKSLTTDLRSGDTLTVTMPDGTKAEIKLDKKSGQIARIIVTADESIKVSKQKPQSTMSAGVLEP